MARINPTDVPDDKLDAVIERLQKEKDARVDRAVEAGEAIKVLVSVVGDEDIEAAKQKALRDFNVPPNVPVHFDIRYHRYPEFCSDGRTPNPMNSAPRIRYDGFYDPLVEQPSPSSHRYPDTDYSRYKPPEPQELILGEPMTVWTEIRRPGPNHLGEIAEGYFIVVDGRVHLSDHLGKAIPGYSDIAGIDPMARARKLLRGKALRERPDEFWAIRPVAARHGGY